MNIQMRDYSTEEIKEKRYILSGNLYDSIHNYLHDRPVDIVKLFASVWGFYKSQVTCNSFEFIHMLNMTGAIIATGFEVDKQQTTKEFLDMLISCLSSADKVQDNNDVLSRGDFLVHAGLELEDQLLSNGQDLTINVSLQENMILVCYQYRSDSISEWMLDRMHRRVLQITEQMVSGQFKLHEISMLDESEFDEVLNHLNQSDSEYPEDQTIIELFEKQVEKTPEQIALEFKGNTLTYRELNARANEVGRKLREQGVQSDTIVGIMTHRSIEMIIGIYGVLKAGGAYLPIDPDLPINRINYMLKDSRSPVVLIGPGLLPTLSQLEDIQIIDLTTCQAELNDNLVHLTQPEHLAYVIYTSGTTGNPKGVMVENRNLVNLALWMLEDEYLPNEVILQKTTYSFDLSIWELFVGYLTGAKLVLIPKEDENDPDKIATLIDQQQVTRTSFVPSVLEEFLPYVDINSMISLRRIQLSGEALPYELANRFNEKSGGRTKLVNSYGPTEATVFSTSYEIPTNEVLQKIHIGKPLANMKIYILNDNQLCGVGLPGELCIGGKGVTRGYLNMPELTADKFIDNPFRSGERIYRTGDLAYWMEGGTIEYLGRIDEQVKIRGFRIELGEIKSKLRGLDGITNAAVIAREDNNDKYLCAYIVGNSNLDIQGIKSQLAESLPSYMVPAHVIQLESLPVTRNGKLDKKALPKPELKSSYPYVSPRDAMEISIVEAFQKILGVDRVGIDDSFFDLGGHSLRAIRLVNTLDESLGIRIGIRDVMTGQTVRRIAETTKHTANGLKLERIAAQTKVDKYEMSSTQKRLYVLQQMTNDSVAYNIPTLLKATGELNMEQLRIALNQLGERHELLRTRFIHDQDNFFQIIDDAVEIPLEYVESNVEDISKLFKEFVKPFDLNYGPLLRMKVVQTRNNGTFLMFDVHHIIYDDASTDIILEDLTQLYGGRVLPSLRVQYKDYSAWENKRDLLEQEQYWLDEFSGEIPILDLQTDYPRSQQQSHNGSSIISKLSKEHKEAVKRLSKESGATEYMIFLSVFMQLLSRYSRQEEIVVGSPIAGRVHPDTEKMLGMFVNTLAIKGHLCMKQSFVELVAQMKEKCLRSYENQEFPFDQLVEKIDLERDLSRNPIFDVMFVMQNNEKQKMTFEGIEVTPIRMESVGSTFDLTVGMEETEDGYELVWEYCTDLFKKETIERMASHFSVLAMDAVGHPNKSLNDLRLLSEKEHEQVIHTFNAMSGDSKEDRTVIQLFEEQVERTPDRIAVEFQDATLSYRELNNLANYVGGWLRCQGVTVESIISLITDRSIEMIVGMLGILKSGAAYLPIDPEHPIERIAYMLKDSGTNFVLAGPGSENALQGLQNIKVFNLIDSLKEEPANLVQISKPHHLAYVIYTSGTTGQPKGVMVENRNLVNQAIWQMTTGNYTQDSVIIQKTTYVFDGSAWEIFSSILAGSKLKLITEIQNKEPDKLLELLPNSQMALIPSMLRILLDYAETHDLVETLRTFDRIYLAAEPITPDLLEKFVRVTGNGLEKLSNLYGPTEATVTATSYSFAGHDQSGIVPIGKPILNTQIYILHGDSLCGIGMPGELCIGGAGVARGYLNRPELTAEKFVDNPFRPGERIYRTGDLARWMSDGNIEYLGRIGEQVKIRGFRIELGEIESRLREIEGIHDAAVIVREDQDEKYVCAYVVGKTELNLKDIKKRLAQTMPIYMIPSYISQLLNLPVTKNGKLDKKSLPKPEIVGNESYVAPRNETEECITELFQEILNVERVGIDDSFFELGGHSLRATRLVNALEQRLGVRLSLRDVITAPTIRRIADFINSTAIVDTYESIQVQPQIGKYEMSSAQKRIYVIHQMQDENITYNIPTLFRVNGNLNLERLKLAITQLSKRHELLRTHFIHEKEKLLQIVEEEVEVKVEYDEASEEVIADLFRQFIRPFDLRKAPLIRVKLVKISDDESALMLDIHHIIYDDASRGILFSELSHLYVGEELPELTVQYKDYSAWQNARDLHSQEKYWMEEFSGEIPILDLKADFARPQQQSHKGSSVTTWLTGEHKSLIKNLVKESGATEYMILLSAFMHLMSRYSRQEEIVIGSPIAGRVHPEAEQMMGMFVNTLAIKGNVRAEQSFIDLITQMKEKCLNAYENQDYPFEQLVENVVFERDVSRNPIFDVVFALQNIESEKLTLGKNSLKPVNMESVAATFDLTVSMEEINEGYRLHWEYCTDLFRRKTIEQMCRHFNDLLTDSLLHPYKAMHDLELIDPEEREIVLQVYNSTETEFPFDKTLIELFEEQVERVPDRIAVEFEGESLTYSELNARANYIGRLLRDQGVNVDSIVGLITGRSLEMIVAMYGILKAGGAYLPIDPEHPIDRIRYMLEDSGTGVVLLGPGVKQDFTVIEGIYIIDLMTSWGQEMDNLSHVSAPEHLAYVIYTSGTTGQPKGVMIENRSLVHLATWQRVHGQMDENSVMLQKSTYIFDAAVWEIFSSGLSGSKLVIATKTQNQDPEELLNLIAEKQISDALIVPSSFRMLLEYAEAQQQGELLKSLQHIYLGAEIVTTDLLEKYVRLTGHGIERLNNLYGPTEGTVCVTSLQFSEGDWNTVPIGKPLWNTQIYIMNGHSLCGIGVPGEICISGTGVARGYLNRPELTAEKFVDNPYRPGERMYRTGDLGRWMADGNVEYLGRIGDQVKIRGFRIELGEIESHLREINGVQDAVVIVRTDQGDPLLCGYVVGTEQLDMTTIKERLSSNLPSYMIPTYLIKLESLPQTKSGKLDKKVLPKPDAMVNKEYTAPRDETEACIAEVFEDILGLVKVGIDDSFFDLGGHSLRASRLVNILEQRLGMRISLRDVLSEQTVRKLADIAKLENSKHEKQRESLFLQLVAAVEEED